MNFPDGSRTLRAKIDMSSHANLNLRDPVMYRISARGASPHGRRVVRVSDVRLGARARSDSIEGITHSICTLEFENHRPLYDWFIDAINERRGPGSEWGEPIVHPQQIEFARLNLNVYGDEQAEGCCNSSQEGHVQRMGRSGDADNLRRCGGAGIRRNRFASSAQRIGVAKFDGVSEIALLEHCVRAGPESQRAPRVMARAAIR